VDELNRLERKGHLPVSIIIIDLNGLKSANDLWGHASGDGLLRRIGEVLNEAVKLPGHAARIGGDEFAIVLPYVDERGAEAMVEDIKRLVEINNQYYSQLQLNLSIGTATTTPGETLEAVAKRADLLMYENKRQQYSSKGGLL
jgi:diguanylate cyclase (GGDEF)-like protein